MIEQQDKLDAQIQPVAKVIRGAGFSFSYHFSSDFMRHRTTAYGQLERKDLPHWRGSVHVSMSNSTFKLDKVIVKAECVRTLVFRSLDIDKILPRFKESVELTKRRYAEADVQQAANTRFEAQREKDFEGWEVPPFLVYDQDRPQWRLMNFRSDTAHTLGRYNVSGSDLQCCLRNLTAAQVKDLCDYLQHVLPQIK